jgi:serine/threonine-protein kinase
MSVAANAPLAKALHVYYDCHWSEEAPQAPRADAMSNAGQTSASPQWVPAPAGADLTGKTLGDYRILRKLGQGGMGQVYLAEQVSLKRKVALKFLRAEFVSSPNSLARFRREAEAVAKATHANIVQVYAIDERDGLHFMALEYVEGRTLKDFLELKGPPDALLAMSIMRQTASALQRAAELGIVHRDIKPENILLTRKGEVKVADFGLSRCLTPDEQPLNLTQSGVTMGTPLYMSPEQVEGKPLDPRSDIYSFGVTCYHMLAGQAPFRGENAFEVALQHVQTQAKPIGEIRGDLPPLLCAIISKMMAKKPDDRYQTCRDVIRDLARVREGMSAASTGETGAMLLSGAVSTTPSTPTLACPTLRRRRWLPWFVAVSLLISAGSGATVGWLRLKKESASTPQAVSAADSSTVDALFSKQKHEQFLKDAVEQYADPGNDPTKIRNGRNHCLELGLLYLDQWRLEEANALFTGLVPSPVDEYSTLGKLGHAIVLGLQNKPAESNKAFLELTKDKRFQKQRPRQAWFFFDNLQLAQWTARALDYNFKNAEKDFPGDLTPLRTPWSGGGRRGAIDKSSGKK